MLQWGGGYSCFVLCQQTKEICRFLTPASPRLHSQYHPSALGGRQWLHTQNREQIQVKTENFGQKWLGCILGVGRENRSSLDLQHHLHTASRAFFTHKDIACDQRVGVKDRLRFFDIVLTLVAMSSFGRRTVSQSDLCRTDVLFRVQQPRQDQFF